MTEPPTLLETSVDDSDPNSRGWDVIDRATWARLSQLVGLPESCRLELVSAIKLERTQNHWRKTHGLAQLGESRKDLSRLISYAVKLREGLQKLDEGASSAVLIALEENANFASSAAISGNHRPEFRDLLDFFDSEPLQGLVTEIVRVQETLSRAVEIARPWRGRVGGNPILRNFLKYLDNFLVRHSGAGLARTSQPKNKPEPSRGTACSDFIFELVRFAYGADAYSVGSIDDAMKDVIALRRPAPVGRESPK